MIFHITYHFNHCYRNLSLKLHVYNFSSFGWTLICQWLSDFLLLYTYTFPWGDGRGNRFLTLQLWFAFSQREGWKQDNERKGGESISVSSDSNFSRERNNKFERTCNWQGRIWGVWKLSKLFLRRKNTRHDRWEGSQDRMKDVGMWCMMRYVTQNDTYRERRSKGKAEEENFACNQARQSKS